MPPLFSLGPSASWRGGRGLPLLRCFGGLLWFVLVFLLVMGLLFALCLAGVLSRVVGWSRVVSVLVLSFVAVRGRWVGCFRVRVLCVGSRAGLPKVPCWCFPSWPRFGPLEIFVAVPSFSFDAFIYGHDDGLGEISGAEIARHYLAARSEDAAHLLSDMQWRDTGMGTLQCRFYGISILWDITGVLHAGSWHMGKYEVQWKQGEEPDAGLTLEQVVACILIRWW